MELKIDRTQRDVNYYNHLTLLFFLVIDAEELADKPLDIAIPVGISVGAFLLILGIIATACFVWSR